MRVRFFQLEYRFALLTSVFCVCLASVVSAAERRAIEVSNPNAPQINPGLNSFESPQAGFHELEKELSRPVFNPKSSLEGIMAPPPQPFIYRPTRPQPLTQREKELRDLRENWALSAPEELVKGLLLDEDQKEKEYGPDGREKKPLTVMERYFENTSRTQTGTNQSGADFFDSRELHGELARRVLGHESQLPEPFPSGVAPNFFAPTIRPEVFADDIFGVNQGKDPRALEEYKKEQEAYQARMDDFKKIWNFQQPAPAVSAQAPSAGTLPSGFESFADQPRNFNATPGVSSSGSLAPQPSAYSTPAPEPAATRVAPPKPTFAAPERRF